MTDLHRIVGVYHAEGSLSGELRYVVGKLLGTAHCALCDITHAGVREKRAFRSCRTAFGIPFETVHLDERDAQVAAFTEGRTPCVVGVGPAGVELLLDATALDRCASSVTAFERALRDALARRSSEIGRSP